MKRVVTIALTPISTLYGAAMTARRAFYGSGRFTIHHLGAPVISVGNLTMGGTGKTPLVEWIARELAQSGKRVCILTRGYGRQTASARTIVSDGNEIIAEVSEAGDEPLLLAERLKGLAAVISDSDRVAAAEWARANLKSDVFVLDDGFQHLRVTRDLNIATVDATNPWGNGKLLPAGILRESPAQLARADCIVITRADDPKATEALQREVATLSKGARIFTSRMRLSGVRAVNSPSNDQEIKAKKVAAFCALGNPDSFFSLLRRAGYELVYTQAFRDHHRYEQSDLDPLQMKAASAGAQVLLTTAKDEVKLRSLAFNLACFTADIEMEIDDSQAFREIIQRTLNR